MKLTKIDMKLGIEDGVQFSFHKSSLMQGALMEWISPEYVEQLHKGGWNPYSQHLEKIGQEWHWIISIFDDEAYEQIYPNIIEKNEVYIRHDDIKIKCIRKGFFRNG